MADKYVLNPDGISDIGTLNESVRELLRTSLEKSQKFFEEMIGTDLWIGEKKEEFMAFYHLVLQYHGWLAGQSVPSFGDHGSSVKVDADCADNLCIAFKDLFNNVNSFDSNSSNYQGLEGIS